MIINDEYLQKWGGGYTLLCVNLSRYPTSIADAQLIASEIQKIEKSSELDGTLRLAGEELGTWIRQPIPTPSYPWFALGMKNRFLAMSAARILDGKIRYETTRSAFQSELPMVLLGSIFAVGPTHHLIGHISGKEPIGVFEFRELKVEDVPMHPSVWSVDREKQTSLLIGPSHDGTVKSNNGSLLQDIVAKRSDLFISRVLGMGSQALAATMTVEPMLGGRAWTSLSHPDKSVKTAAALWLNSTLGMLVRLGYAQTTQPGRATLGVKAMAGLPIPNFAEESESGEWARLVAEDQFDRLAELELQPAAYAWRDENRHEIDWCVLNMLGIDSPETRSAITQIRELWCREPSVHGGNRKIMKALGIGE